LQVLIEGCELEQLCTFLRNCIDYFSVIAVDKNGSHVAEAALKSLATHLEDEASRAMIERILNKICKVFFSLTGNISHSIFLQWTSHLSHCFRLLLWMLLL
jgi:nucleolar protein 9